VAFSVSRKQLLISKNIEDSIPAVRIHCKKGKTRSLVPGVTSARQKDRLVQGEKNISEILNNVLKAPMLRNMPGLLITPSTLTMLR